MRKFLVYTAVVFLFLSCSKRVTIEGNLSDAPQQTVYIEHLALQGVQLVDSVRTNKHGRFRAHVPFAAEPDFYRVRIGSHYIVLGLDSTTVKIEIEGNVNNLLGVDVRGSEQTELIQQLRVSSRDLEKAAKENDLEAVSMLFDAHKALGKEIVMRDTRSAAAYYAVNQRYKGAYFLSPGNDEELKYWAAVATAFDTYYPENPRSKLLKETTLQGLKRKRSQQLDVQQILRAAGQEGYIDIVLPDRVGTQTPLSSLEGKIVVIDFVVAELDNYAAHTILLRDLYSSYSDKGVEIYQVSLDANNYLWMEKTRALPWVCVRDAASTASRYLLTYNVTELPTMFVMDVDGTVVGRFTHDNIEAALDALLSKGGDE